MSLDQQDPPQSNRCETHTLAHSTRDDSGTLRREDRKAIIPSMLPQGDDACTTLTTKYRTAQYHPWVCLKGATRALHNRQILHIKIERAKVPSMLSLGG